MLTWNRVTGSAENERTSEGKTVILRVGYQKPRDNSVLAELLFDSDLSLLNVCHTKNIDFKVLQLNAQGLLGTITQIQSLVTELW